MHAPRARRQLIATLALTGVLALGGTLPVAGQTAQPGGTARVAARFATRPHGTFAGGAVTRPGQSGTEMGVTVEAQPGHEDEAAFAIWLVGGQVVNRRGRSIEAWVPAGRASAIASAPSIARARPIIPPVAMGTVSAGVALHGADTWQAAGYTGTGVRIGIIDSGFIGLSARLGIELPATVHARCYSSIGVYSASTGACETHSVHGTAVAETIYDMAPGSSLYVANPVSLLDFTSTVAWMTSNGVKIINSSLGFAFQGPGDGTDPSLGSIYSVLNQAVSAGALWVNASGNSGEDGWTGPWADADADEQLDFGPSINTDPISLSAGQSLVVTLRWNDPWGHSANDYDLYLLPPGSQTPVASSTDSQSGSGDPVETFAYTAPAAGQYSIAVARHAGAPVSRLQLLVLTGEDAPLQYRTVAGTLPSPADSASAGMLTVGAVDVASPAVIEPYSSRGPTVDGRVKPDLVAGDCAATSVEDPFCGTSQAAPYVAGAAALVLQKNPALTPSGLAAWLRSHTIPLGSPVPNSTFGAGRLDLGQLFAAAGLSFAVQPGGSIAAGDPLPVQPSVAVVDASGATVASGPSSTATVTLSLGAGPAGALLSCSGGLSRPAVAGIATFAGCAVTPAGTGYRLAASATGLAAATSTPFDISPAAPLHPLLIVAASPGNSVAGVPFAQPPVIRVTDGAGATITAGSAANLPVTLALAPGSGATLTCSGGLTRWAAAGVAIFPGCAISAAGIGFTLTASAPTSIGVSAAAFDVAPGAASPAPTLAFATTTSIIGWGSQAGLSATLSVPAGNVGPAGRLVRFEASPDGVTRWQTVGTAAADQAGIAAFTYRPATNLWYRAFFDGAADLARAGSATARITVRSVATLRPAPGSAVRRAAVGSTVRLTTTVRPISPARPPGWVTFQIRHRVGSRWVLASTRRVRANSSGRAVLDVTWTAGSWYVRSMAEPTPVNANSVWTEHLRYDVR